MTDQKSTAPSPNPEGETPMTEENPNAEAARYRRQLREVEAERDTLAAQVTTLQRQRVEQIAAEVLDKPAAIWLANVQLSDLLAADGVTVDRDKVTQVAVAAAEELGLVTYNPNPVSPGAGKNPRWSGEAPRTFSDAFKPN